MSADAIPDDVPTTGFTSSLVNGKSRHTAIFADGTRIEISERELSLMAAAFLQGYKAAPQP